MSGYVDLLVRPIECHRFILPQSQRPITC
jgi:hypothetical protein